MPEEVVSVLNYRDFILVFTKKGSVFRVDYDVSQERWKVHQLPFTIPFCLQ